MMKYLQKLGKALMLPVACLPICGILMGIGYALCPATMQGGDIAGAKALIGFFLVKAGGALIDNMAWLFVIGVGVGMADDNDGTAALAALASWLMITNLLSTGVVTTLMPSIARMRIRRWHSIRLQTRLSVFLPVSSEQPVITSSRERSFRTGWHFSAANAVLPSYPVWYRLSCQLSCYSYGRLCSAH